MRACYDGENGVVMHVVGTRMAAGGGVKIKHATMYAMVSWVPPLSKETMWDRLLGTGGSK